VIADLSRRASAARRHGARLRIVSGSCRPEWSSNEGEGESTDGSRRSSVRTGTPRARRTDRCPSVSRSVNRSCLVVLWRAMRRVGSVIISAFERRCWRGGRDAWRRADGILRRQSCTCASAPTLRVAPPSAGHWRRDAPESRSPRLRRGPMPSARRRTHAGPLPRCGTGSSRRPRSDTMLRRLR
jgi:hypothetical protein